MISLAARALEVLGPRGCPLVGSVSDGWTASFEGSSSEASAALPTLTHAPPQRGFQGVGRSVGPDSRLSHWTVLRLIPVRYEREQFFGGELTGITPSTPRVFGQFFPYVVHDLYGTTVIPDPIAPWAAAQRERSVCSAP